jgi:hypothetical protein
MSKDLTTPEFKAWFRNIIELRDTLSSVIAWWKQTDSSTTLASRKMHTIRALEKLVNWTENPVAVEQVRKLIAELKQED